jgi:hypothetical protein
MATYNLIASNTVGSGGASIVTFSSIPSTYTDLVIKASPRNVSGGISQIKLQFNSSGGTAYTDTTIEGTGSSVSSFRRTGQAYIWAIAVNSTANNFGNYECYIPNYAGSSYKSVSIDSVIEANATAAYQNLVAGLWSNTAAITSISLEANGVDLAQYSSFYLYGIKNS